jgi:two-component system CheB/CheR fusion protein
MDDDAEAACPAVCRIRLLPGETVYSKPMQTQLVARDFRVVCLGGSAGGLQAYLEIFRMMPPDTGMAFVVALHRGVEYAELLPRILSAATRMPVLDVEEGMALEPNAVFVMPPRTNMTLTGDTFHLRTIPVPFAWPKTITVFLLSMAEELGSRAVAVILSGFDHDGSAALKPIKAAGGLTFAQADPSVASMPHSAVQTGEIDYLLPAAEIGKAILALARKPLPRGRS